MQTHKGCAKTFPSDSQAILLQLLVYKSEESLKVAFLLGHPFTTPSQVFDKAHMTGYR